jgi:hypothetical protein
MRRFFRNSNLERTLMAKGADDSLRLCDSAREYWAPLAAELGRFLCCPVDFCARLPKNLPPVVGSEN